MLGRNDGIDYGGEIVDVGEGFDAEDDVVEGALLSICGFFGLSDDCEWSAFLYIHGGFIGRRLLCGCCYGGGGSKKGEVP